jgi:phospholipase C
VLNDLQQRPEWKSTAVFLTWDDSDGWYDHLMGPIVNSSVGPIEALNGDGMCGDGTSILPGISPANRHALGRCGYGPRLPLLVMSPWARTNAVDSTVTDQTSIARFIEDVFLDGRRIGGGSFDAIAGSLNHVFDFARAPNLAPLLLDERTGQPRRSPGSKTGGDTLPRQSCIAQPAEAKSQTQRAFVLPAATP